jgi:hypothetical protein
LGPDEWAEDDIADRRRGREGKEKEEAEVLLDGDHIFLLEEHI